MNAQEIIQKNALLECIHCGTCTGSCPAALTSKLNIRKSMHKIAVSNDVIIPPDSELWSCTTCSTCQSRCPRGISPLDVMIDLRSAAVEMGTIPSRVRDALESVYIHGNPWRRNRRERSDWTQGVNLKEFTKDTDVLFYVGCTSSYDSRSQDEAKALVKCLNKAEVNFGTLGNEEVCCGSEIYGIGEKGLFNYLVNKNMETFENKGVKKIVTASPHCFHTFKNRYGKINFEVQHYTQYLAELIEKKKLELTREVNKTIAYHDPCFLGKMNGVYDEPRKIIESIPSVKFIELGRSREKSLCCGGGGGGMWVDVQANPTQRIERLAEKRVKEAVDVGAELLVTSCPFCILTLEDAVKTTGNEGAIRIIDLAELVTDAL